VRLEEAAPVDFAAGSKVGLFAVDVCAALVAVVPAVMQMEGQCTWVWWAGRRTVSRVELAVARH
jgi:hypothetical protein